MSAVAFDGEVVIFGRADQVEAVLEAGAAAAVHGHAQHQRTSLARGERLEPFGRRGGKGDLRIGHGFGFTIPRSI